MEKSLSLGESLRVDYTEQYPVSGRELHARLGIGTAYKDWFPRMREYGFEEGKDFCSKMSESTGGRPATDHVLTLSMAKELCMLQRTEQGREVRRYLIQVEDAWNRPEMVFARALKMADEKLAQANEEIAHLKIRHEEMSATISEQGEQLALQAPKVEFADTLLKSEDCIKIGDLAKVLCDGKINIGPRRLFDLLRGRSILMTGFGWETWKHNTPYQQYIDAGYFQVRENTWADPHGKVHVSNTTLVTPKGQEWIKRNIAKWMSE